MREKTVTDFLRDGKIRAVASFVSDSRQDFDSEKMSDYDVFSTLCSKMPLFVFHPIRKSFLFTLENALGEKIDYASLDDMRYQKLLWQKIFNYESKGDCFERIFPQRCFLQINHEDKRAISLNDVLDLSFDTIFILLNNLLEYIRLNEIEEVVLDLKSINYCRPDDFHAAKCYEELKTKKSKADASVLLLWLLCRILMKLKLRLVMISDKLSDVEQVMELFSTIKLSPEIIARVSIASNSLDEATEFILNYRKKNIRVEIFVPTEMTLELLEVRIKHLASSVPLAMVSFYEEYSDNVSVYSILKKIIEKELGFNESRLVFTDSSVEE